ncbi:hypothetical protein BDZ94DRAFT_1250986 [Collybia nuda]|uniref:NAD-dependent epimerase/dehydratase domain-containing protein n=1 Tax=Collybia nuda TaxID=64659 RepID=A0A9P5YD41_9AGAR|nr:hypothetical protein BDZ94DRAFT_1250986 [Collybia nuda]
MKIAVTGCNGRVGKPVVALALARGHSVVGIDYNGEPSAETGEAPSFTYTRANLKDYETALKLLEGCDSLIHLAAHPDPGDYNVTSHNDNVVLSWNVLRACAELNVTRIAQASSVNVVTMVYSEQPNFEYFPIDEQHPTLPDEPYGLSKLICEMQADTIVRRYPALRVASLRLHWSTPSRDHARRDDPSRRRRDLWGYVQQDSAADAFLLSVTEENGRWRGHEAFFIVAPRIACDVDSKVLRETHWPNVPVIDGKDVSGQKGFFDCRKAERLLGWVHRDGL